MTFGGIDLGGTKIEARYFDKTLRQLGRNRISTPRSYDGMIRSVADQVHWLEAQGPLTHVGVGVPGLANPGTGRMLTANIAATGRPLADDLIRAAGREVSVVNDCRAFALSEALRGAGQNCSSVLGLVIGTGVAGGLVVNGQLLRDLNGQHCELGHLPLPADVANRLDLPLIPCGCGLTGCYETFLSGPGLVRLATHVAGRNAQTAEIMTEREFRDVRLAWADIAGSLIGILARVIDPEIVVLGGGIGSLPGVPEMIMNSLQGKLLSGTKPPAIATAAHGDASGALGAALFAIEEAP